MKNNFLVCMRHILDFEGGYSKTTNDRGGATNYGITQAVYDSYRKNKQLPIKSVETITQEEVQDIYKNLYWDKCNCDQLLSGIDLIVFDTAVNMGVGRASIFLQKVLGVQVDGVIGKDTISKQTSMDKTVLINLYVDMRLDYYNKIVKNDPTQQKFLKGWSNRLKLVEAYTKNLK